MNIKGKSATKAKPALKSDRGALQKPRELRKGLDDTSH